MFFEIAEFFIYTSVIVLIAKYILVKLLRKLAENLNLKPKTVGNITGYATSIPEFLTVSISSVKGLSDTSAFNIFSSNIINFIQYIISVVISKNRKAFTNKAIKINIILVFITIIIPIFFIWKNIKMTLKIVPIFVILYFLFLYLNNNVHKLYLQKEDRNIENEINKESEGEKNNTRKTAFYIIMLIITGIVLYIISELLGVTLNNLHDEFNISQEFIGIILGFITSIPELITFFESQKHHNSQEKNSMLGVVEATNNLLTSNILNLFLIQSIGIIIFSISR